MSIKDVYSWPHLTQREKIEILALFCSCGITIIRPYKPKGYVCRMGVCCPLTDRVIYSS